MTKPPLRFWCWAARRSDALRDFDRTWTSNMFICICCLFNFLRVLFLLLAMFTVLQVATYFCMFDKFPYSCISIKKIKLDLFSHRLCAFFLQYDPENSGFISTERFRDLLATHGSELDPHKLEVLLALADGNADGKICYQDFVNLVRCFNLLQAHWHQRLVEINSLFAHLTLPCVPMSMFRFSF